MSATNLPNLSSLNAQMAQQTQVVHRVLDAFEGSLDNLANAASLRNWNQVLQLSKEIKQLAITQNETLVAEAAEEIIRSLPHGNDSDNLRRVIRLLGASGQVKRTSV